MRKSTRSFAFLLCIALFVCMLGTTTAFADKGHKPQEPWDLAAAEKVYNRTTTFNHVDIRVYGTITYKTYVNGVETGSETKTVKISNPVITITRQDGKTLTKSFSNTTSYEWRWTEYNGRKLQINKEDSISLTCDITIDGVTKTGQHFSWAGKDAFVQAIYNCDGHQGLDFNVEDEFDEDEEEGTITIYGDDVKAYAQIQKFLEDQGFEDIGGEFTYVPNDLKDVDAEQRATIDKMVERLEDFDDVQNVYTNMKPEEGE